MELTEQEWKERLTDEQYAILRQGESEQAGTGRYCHYDKPGNYHCVACNALLFTSNEKYDGANDWPSFYDSASLTSVVSKPDRRREMEDMEVCCATCHGHLGHVFIDGSTPTGLHYCINSAVLDFKKETI